MDIGELGIEACGPFDDIDDASVFGWVTQLQPLKTFDNYEQLGDIEQRIVSFAAGTDIKDSSAVDRDYSVFAWGVLFRWAAKDLRESISERVEAAEFEFPGPLTLAPGTAIALRRSTAAIVIASSTAESACSAIEEIGDNEASNSFWLGFGSSKERLNRLEKFGADSIVGRRRTSSLLSAAPEFAREQLLRKLSGVAVDAP